jgi:hypothetical protein
LLPAGNRTHEGAHDEVALTALGCILSFGNKTENWKVTLELLKLSLPIAESQSARSRFEENIRIVTGNLDYQLQYGTCWFCRERPSEDTAAVEIKMYGEVTRTFGRIQWRYTTLKVPRCSECKSIHSQMNHFIKIGSGVGAMVGIGGCTAVINAVKDGGGFGFFLFLGCILLGLGIGWRFDRARFPEGIKPESHKTQFASVQKLLSEGWKFGEKPPTN